MLRDLTLTHWLTLHSLVTVVAVLVYVVSSRVMRQRRPPTSAIAWMLFILLVPYVALPAFLVFGSRKLPRPRFSAPLDASRVRGTASWAVETILALGQPSPAAYRELRVHADGREAHEALLATIAGARASLDVCTFILGRDRIGDEVMGRLCDKARAGVRVRFLLDGMGNLMAGQPNLRRLADAGGEPVLFVPPLRSSRRGRANLRNHRKLVVADAGLDDARLWCGGRNLASEYFEGEPGKGAWHDLTIDVRGPLVAQAAALFEQDFAFARRRAGVVPAGGPPAPPFLADGAQLVASGPDQADDTVHALMVTAAYRARDRLALATPYFVPEPALLTALCMAARRGVVVDLLVPARSNHRLSDVARGRALRALAEAGGRIWLAPRMLHAKLAVTDDTLALVGSANLDSRSLFLNYELMVAFHAPADVGRLAAWLDAERADATAYVPVDPGLVRDAAEGLLLWVGFQL